jgi:outer membrane protein assembly factor BamB
MHDESRSGLSDEDLTLPLSPAWVYRAVHAPQPAWPPPAKQDFWHNKYGLKGRVIFDRAFHVVSDGTRVFFGSSADDQVRCLDLASGRKVWTFFAEGPVRLAPTLAEGRIYFGSDDGCVYCLNAADGALVWAYRVAERDRRIPGNGRIISTWPVRSGVLIEGNRARFAAGLFPGQGTYQFFVDRNTGKLLSKTRLSFSPQGYMQRRGDQLMIATGRSPPAALERAQRSGKTAAATLGPVPAKYPFALIGAGDLRFAGGHGEVAVLRAGDRQLIDTLTVEGKAYGLAVAGGALLVSTDQGCIYCFRARTAGAKSGNERETARDLGHAGTLDARETATAEPVWPKELTEVCSAAADRIVAKTNIHQGYCLVLGSGEGCLAYEIARRSRLTVVGIDPDTDCVARSRAAIDRLGLYGRVSIDQGSLGPLPYASFLFNLVVSERALVDVAAPGKSQEALRVLRPCGGTAMIGRPAVAGASGASPDNYFTNWVAGQSGWKRSGDHGTWMTFVRPPLKKAGAWTHIYAEPGNTACSQDQLIRPPFRIQWFGEPGPRDMIDRHHRTVPPLCCNGRLFVPGNERIFVLDAYNGTILWSRDIPGFRRIAALRDSGNMAATDDRVFVTAKDSCHAFDAQTGALLRKHAAPSAEDNSARDWGYVAVLNQRLYGSGTRPGASHSQHSRAAIGNAYYDRRPMVTSTCLFCRDAATGNPVWLYQAVHGAILNSTITIGDGRMYFVESGNAATLEEESGRVVLADLLAKGAAIVALDLNVGTESWRRAVDFAKLEHCLTLGYTRERLVAIGSRNDRASVNSRPTVWYDTHVFRATDGELQWSRTQDNRQGAGGSHGEQDHHPAIVGNTVYVEPLAYDLDTGQRIESWKYTRGGHGCGTFSASADALFFRASNPTMCDLAAGTRTKLTHVTRPGCWINIIPAGGLVLIPEASSGCTCKFSIQASLALAPTLLEEGDLGSMK